MAPEARTTVRAPHRRFLQPGGLLVGSGRCEVMTVLGPCVAVTIWNRRPRIAAICHAMLPTAPGKPGHGQEAAPWKYVDTALPEMVARIGRRIGLPASLEVKLFGGADLFTTESRSQIGSKNVERVREILAALSLPIAAFDVGGKAGRKLIFDMDSGEVWIKRLPRYLLDAA